MRVRSTSAVIAILLLLPACFAQLGDGGTTAAPPPAKVLVTSMVAVEQQARHNRALFSFVSEERSSRTDGHLWREKVVERPDGLLRRLIAEDGKPLSPERAQGEERRLMELAMHPDLYELDNRNRRQDEAHAATLLGVVPQAFVFEYAGSAEGCVRIAFKPDPAYQPDSLEQRVMHSMAGNLSIKLPEKRLCSIDAQLIDRVEIGYGFLGHINPGGHILYDRIAVNPIDWKTSRLSVHLDGKILFLKSISRDQESRHFDFKAVPPGLSMIDAVALTRP